MKMTTTVLWSDEEGCWIARMGDYPDLKGRGQTSFEALNDLEKQLPKDEGEGEGEGKGEGEDG